MNEVYTAQQLADLAGVHRETILRMIRTGRIQATRVANVQTIRKEDGDKFLSTYEKYDTLRKDQP